MKMYEIIDLQGLYQSIANIRLPLKTSYKFTRLMRRVEEELIFYQTKLQEILEDCAEMIDGRPALTPDGRSIMVAQDKRVECEKRLTELRNLEVQIEGIKFSLEELEGIDISIAELSCLMSLIEE